MLRWEILATACYAAAIAAGLSAGLLGVAAAYTAMALVLWPLSHVVANRLIGLSTASLFRALLPQAALAAALGAAVFAIRVLWQPATPEAQATFVAVAVLLGAATLGGALLAGRPAVTREALLAFKSLLPGRRSPA
jgi:hypothetical protein